MEESEGGSALVRRASFWRIDISRQAHDSKPMVELTRISFLNCSGRFDCCAVAALAAQRCCKGICDLYDLAQPSAVRVTSLLAILSEVVVVKRIG